MEKNDILKQERLGQEKLNNQGSPMKIIEYNNSSDMTVEFQDKYQTRVKTIYVNFQSGSVKNPYAPSIHGVGIVGDKYPIWKNGKPTKEYSIWATMLKRCFYKNLKEKQPTYKDVTCCGEWLLFENFYEWLHSQENFWQWKSNKRYALDKDIIVKNNKVYSPETCCIVPQNVNCLFLKREADRGDLPIGVRRNGNLFSACCHNPFTNKAEKLGTYQTINDAFQSYKTYKEYLIKSVAQIEYNNGNITKKCYDAMIEYQVEMTD